MTKRHKFRIVVTLLLGLALIVALFYGQSLNLKTLAALRIDWPFAIGMIACSYLYIALGAWKWQAISRQWYGEAPSFTFHLNQMAQVMLWGQFLPLPVATAIQRAAVMRIEQSKPVAQGLAHAAYDLGFDFVIVFALAPLTLLQLHFDFSWLCWTALGVGGFAFLWLLLFFSEPLLRLLAKCVGPQTRATLEAWQHHGLMQPHFMTFMLSIGTARFAVSILRLCLGAAALGLELPWDAIAYTTPLATLPSLIPITPANLGVAEWSWAYLLSLWQVPVALGALFATGFRLLTLAVQFFIALTIGLYASLTTEVKK